jgi:hypothetical protein
MASYASSIPSDEQLSCTYDHTKTACQAKPSPARAIINIESIIVFPTTHTSTPVMDLGWKKKLERHNDKTQAHPLRRSSRSLSLPKI